LVRVTRRVGRVTDSDAVNARTSRRRRLLRPTRLERRLRAGKPTS
jgi:hypothetical protein